ncbi:hypothetical protein Q5752_000073 [Cryptotrichosporon argae]
MDPTTTAYVEPTALAATTTRDGYPALAVDPAVPLVQQVAVPLPASSLSGPDAQQAQSNNPFSNNPFSGSTGHPGSSEDPTKADLKAQFEAALSHADAHGAGAAHDAKNAAGETASNVQAKAGDAAASVRDMAADTASSVQAKAGETAASAKVSAADTAARARESAASTLDAARSTAADVRADPRGHAEAAKRTAADYGNAAAAKTGETATAVRQRVHVLGSKATDVADRTRHHPAVQNAAKVVEGQVQQLREVLGRSKTVRELEARTNVDRVYLVVGGALLFAALVPLNLFGLALPITTLLAVAPAAYLSLALLDQGVSADDARVKSLLSYFVVLGFVQLLESLAAGVLEKRIPHYYTLKLAFLAYLLHPRTRGSDKVYENALKPALRAATAAPAASSANPQTPPTSVPHFAASPGPAITKADARGQAFDVVSEKQPVVI